jgi:hypothetical protein
MTQHVDAERIPHGDLDEPRVANARTASHGFGAGQTESRWLMSHWSDEEATQHATEILDRVELAQDFAQAAPSSFEDYVARLRAADPADDPLTRDRHAALGTIYQAGFDVGFSAALVEGCRVLLGRPVTIAETGSEHPADNTDVAYLTWS